MPLTKGYGSIRHTHRSAPSRHGNVNHSPRKGGRTAYAASFTGKFPSDYGARSKRYGSEIPPWLKENN